MTKIANNPKEKMRMNIELADNGIIIRNPDCEDDVTLAVTTGDYNMNIDHSDEYKKIGRRIYNWLMDVVIQDHASELIITNFDIDITATCKGRPM